MRNTRYAGEEWAEDVEMIDADVAAGEGERCVADENSDPNVTRTVVTRLLRNSIFARVLHGPKKDREVAITKVFTTHNMGAFQLERRQLPIRVAFAMTINKAQGLTLRRVGVHVEEDVFSHGQLYVAFSRCGDPDNLWVFGPEPDEHGAVWIKNVVFKEVLIDDKEPVDTS